VADGRFESDPTIEEALRMRVAQILAGGYDEKARRVSPALWERIMERDGRRCVICGEPATQIHHIAGSDSAEGNLRATCATCNPRLAQAQLVPAPPDKAAQADLIIDRMFSPTPVFERDDVTAWPARLSALLSERRRLVHDHLAGQKLLGRMGEIKAWLAADNRELPRSRRRTAPS
jgi:hypothetical protein